MFDMNDLDFILEVWQRVVFDSNDFIFKFQLVIEEMLFGNLRIMFVNDNFVLVMFLGEGVVQNLVMVGFCVINQLYNYFCVIEIFYIIEGMC